MFYNKLEARQDNGRITITLDKSDTQDRIEKQEHIHCGGPGIAFIYYPRIDDDGLTDKKYKNILICYMIKQLEKEKKAIEESISWLELKYVMGKLN